METMQEKEKRILNHATAEQMIVLSNDYLYGSKQSFWGTALRFGLVERGEYERARHYYGNLWNYRGD